MCLASPAIRVLLNSHANLPPIDFESSTLAIVPKRCWPFYFLSIVNQDRLILLHCRHFVIRSQSTVRSRLEDDNFGNDFDDDFDNDGWPTKVESVESALWCNVIWKNRSGRLWKMNQVKTKRMMLIDRRHSKTHARVGRTISHGKKTKWKKVRIVYSRLECWPTFRSIATAVPTFCRARCANKSTLNTSRRCSKKKKEGESVEIDLEAEPKSEQNSIILKAAKKKVSRRMQGQKRICDF